LGLAIARGSRLKSSRDSADFLGTGPNVLETNGAASLTELGFPADLSFLHLSDIHFRKGRMGDAHDVDNDVRNELARL
jgi:hypothetical protein